MKLSLRLVLLPALGGTVFLGGCYEVPVTGRRALNIVSDQEMAKMSIAMFDDMKARSRLSRDKEKVEQLRRVGERLRQAIPIWDMPDADWEFVVFEEKSVNAFAMAGGKVGVFSGLFKIIANDDQLASVIGHEIAHVTAKHVHESFSRAMALETVGMVGGVAMMGTGMSIFATESLMSIYGLGAHAGQFAFDRSKEKEADYIGMIYMARAGYNPEECAKVLEKLEELETTEQTAAKASWTSTHPPNPERIAALTETLPKAFREQQKANQVITPKVIK
ncbi:MAG: M48 family metallopeptidase [Verrucomicrobia bacterium]|nr:M48 family metallopeptidase [Verrucomicrobiota bacterium]